MTKANGSEPLHCFPSLSLSVPFRWLLQDVQPRHPFLQKRFAVLKLSACQQEEIVINSSLKGRQDVSTDKLEAYANQRSETEKAYEIIQALSREVRLGRILL